jgi:acyl dehydratase
MIRAAGLVLTLALGVAACQTVGPVHLGEINQGRATVLAKTELARRHMEAIEGWRAQVDDYATIWVVTFYRPAAKSDGPPFVRVSLNKHTERVVAVTTGD